MPTIHELLKTTDPNFLNEYKDYLINYGGKAYTVQNGQLAEALPGTNLESYNQNRTAVTLENTGELQPAGKSSFGGTEGYRYTVNPPTTPTTTGTAFRAINPGEELGSYLKLKQTYDLAQTGKTDINFGNPTQTPAPAGVQPQTLGAQTGATPQYPTTNLTPGMTGDAVKQLQDYLVSQGYMTQAQVNTGYGIYGPQTTSAVAALQAKLGVDTAGNPGYWGPRTLATLSGQTTSTPSYREGDSRTNPTTGSKEFLSPDGTWQPVLNTTQTTGGTYTADTLSTGTTPTISPVTTNSTVTPVVSTVVSPTDNTQAKKDLETAKTETTSLLDRIKVLFGQTEGKATEEAQLMETAKITQQEKDIQDLTNQLNSISAEAQAANLTLESQAGGKDVTGTFLGRQQQEVNRQSAIQSLTVSSQLQAKQGNLTLALSQIDRAIKLKYEPLETELKNKVSQLELLDKYVLTPAETARKEELAMQYDAQQTELATQKAKDTVFEKSLVDAMKNGMPNTEVAQVRSLYEQDMVDEANLAISKYTGNTVELDTSVIEVGGRKLLVNNQTGETIKDLGTVKVVIPETAVTPPVSEVDLNTQIEGFKSTGISYDTVVGDINSSTTITDKKTALEIAKNVYGIAKPESFVSKVSEKVSETIGNLSDSIYAFLFNRK